MVKVKFRGHRNGDVLVSTAIIQQPEMEDVIRTATFHLPELVKKIEPEHEARIKRVLYLRLVGAIYDEFGLSVIFTY